MGDHGNLAANLVTVIATVTTCGGALRWFFKHFRVRIVIETR